MKKRKFKIDAFEDKHPILATMISFLCCIAIAVCLALLAYGLI